MNHIYKIINSYWNIKQAANVLIIDLRIHIGTIKM